SLAIPRFLSVPPLGESLIRSAPRRTAPMHETQAALRHDIRGTLNALKLCLSAFDMPLEPSEKLEFFSDKETAADRIAELVGELEAMTAAADAGAGIGTGNVR